MKPTPRARSQLILAPDCLVDRIEMLFGLEQIVTVLRLVHACLSRTTDSMILKYRQVWLLNKTRELPPRVKVFRNACFTTVMRALQRFTTAKAHFTAAEVSESGLSHERPIRKTNNNIVP